MSTTVNTPHPIRILLAGLSSDRIEMHLLQSLVQAGAEVEVIRRPGDPIRELCEQLGVVHTEHAFSGRLDRAGQRLIKSSLNRTSFDIIHAFDNRALSNTLFVLMFRRSQEKLIAYRGTSGHISRLDPACWMSYLHPRIDQIVCVSNSVKGYLHQVGIPESKLITIHKGHDAAWYEQPGDPDYSEFGFPENAFVVGFVGNMRPVKGVDYLIKALDFIDDPSIHLLLVGEVRHKAVQQLADEPTRRDRIHLTGFRPDAPALAKGFDIGIMPSVEREGFPKALVQYMIQGIPSVVSDVGGMPELVTNRETGLIVPPRDARALAEAIQELARDRELRSRLGENARQNILTSFHVDQTMEKTFSLYNRLLEPCEEVQPLP